MFSLYVYWSKVRFAEKINLGLHWTEAFRYGAIDIIMSPPAIKTILQLCLVVSIFCPSICRTDEVNNIDQLNNKKAFQTNQVRPRD